MNMERTIPRPLKALSLAVVAWSGGAGGRFASYDMVTKDMRDERVS